MKQLPSVDIDTDTFSSWILKTNGIIALCNTEVVTANNNPGGATTTGTGFVIGAFGANTIMATVIRGGNTTVNAAFQVSSNAIFTANTYRFDPGVTLGSNSLVHHHGTRLVTTTTTADQVADSFSATAYRSAKYVISITDSNANAFQATELLVLSDGGSTYSTEYATLTSNNSLATFKTDISGGNVRLLITPLVAGAQTNISRTLVST